jgi:hypothetical protein
MLSWIISNPVARKIGAILLAIVGVFAAYKIWKSNVENGVRRQEREANRARSAEAQAEMVSTITENSNEYVRQSDAVRSHDFAERMPDGGARLSPENYRD